MSDSRRRTRRPGEGRRNGPLRCRPAAPIIDPVAQGRPPRAALHAVRDRAALHPARRALGPAALDGRAQPGRPARAPERARPPPGSPATALGHRRDRARGAQDGHGAARRAALRVRALDAARYRRSAVTYAIENALFQWEEGEARIRDASGAEAYELERAARLVME